jgi:hypothetical protein
LSDNIPYGPDFHLKRNREKKKKERNLVQISEGLNLWQLGISVENFIRNEEILLFFKRFHLTKKIGLRAERWQRVNNVTVKLGSICEFGGFVAFSFT